MNDLLKEYGSLLKGIGGISPIDESSSNSAKDYAVVTTPFELCFSIKEDKKIIIPKGSSLPVEFVVPVDDKHDSTSSNTLHSTFVFYIKYHGVNYPITIYDNKEAAISDGWNFELPENTDPVPDITDIENEDMFKPNPSDYDVVVHNTNEEYGYNIKTGQAYYSLASGFIRYTMRLSVLTAKNVDLWIQLADGSTIRFRLREKIIDFLVNMGYVLSKVNGVKPDKKKSTI